MTAASPNSIRIYLDDWRSAPEGYTLVRSVNKAKELIVYCEQKGIEIEIIDCDYFLEAYAFDGGDGPDLLVWLAERKTYYPIALHSSSSWGRGEMEDYILEHWYK